MKRLCLVLLMIFVFATPAMATDGSVFEQIKKESGQFNPDDVGKHMEQKARQLWQLAKSGSSLYIAITLIVFLCLLIGGIFFKKMIKLAFFSLFVAAIGCIVLNYWQEIRDGIMAFIDWLFRGDADENTSGV